MPWRPLNREQAWMLPPTLDELMPADHPARFVAEFVDALGSEEWAELGVKIDGEPLGAPGYHPRALLSVWLYGFMSGVRSSRKLEAACRDQVPYLWLTGRQHPDHNTLWRFYAQHRRAMRTLFDRTVRTAVAMDLVDLAVQAVDGTKVGANASLRRTRDTAALGRLTERLEQAIDDLEAQGEAGTDAVPARLPQQLASQQALRARVREAMEELAERPELRRINLTDPEARLMKTPHGIVPGYNAQAMVSPAGTDRGSGGMLVTAAEVVDAPVDNEQLAPMLERARETTGMAATLTLADAGYHSGRALEACERREQRVVMPEARQRLLEHPYHKDRFRYEAEHDHYICPEGQPLRFLHTIPRPAGRLRVYRSSGAVCGACPAFGVCTNTPHGRSVAIGRRDAVLRRHREWMTTAEAKAAYRRRAALVEPVFGILKEELGARRFLLRGLPNVAAEWTVLATAFNLRTLWRAWRTGRRLHWSSGLASQPAG